MTHKISIIIPTYLEEKMLGGLLSLFTEDIKHKYNLEIIVSDGGSTDDTLDIAKSSTADIVVEHNYSYKPNIARGRNAGAAKASGDIFVFTNADCLPSDIETMLAHIIEWSDSPISKNKYVAIACKVNTFKEERKFIDNIFYSIFNAYFYILNIVGIGMGRGECQVIRREVFEQLGGYNAELVAGEDFDLFHRVCKAGYKVLFSRKIIILESPRRFRKYGYLKTLLYWMLNGVSVMFRKRSVSKEWEAVR